MHHFERVGIIGFVEKLIVKGTVKRLARYLASIGYTPMIEEKTLNDADIHDFPSYNRQQLGELCDLIIVVGGDGSFLHAARDLVDYQVPLLGVNRGRLGFLTDISPESMERGIADVLAGQYSVSHRLMLDCDLLRNGDIIASDTALNDVVMQPLGSISMIGFELCINNQLVYRQRADGLIIATPTGSTAYALSGGGPIIHPTTSVLSIVPINPHTLSSRPIVVDGSSDLELRILSDNRVDVQLVCDGQEYLPAKLGDIVRVRKKATQLKIIHPADNDFYHTCRTKLNWANDL